MKTEEEGRKRHYPKVIISQCIIVCTLSLFVEDNGFVFNWIHCSEKQHTKYEKLTNYSDTQIMVSPNMGYTRFKCWLLS